MLSQTAEKLPGRQKIFVSVATVIQEVFVPIGIPEK